MPRTQHHQADSHSDIHPPNTEAAEPKPTTTCSVLTNPFHVSLVLENRGSVARDHLALERTYLAYVRTSLAIASAGVALVQLFTISSKNTNVHFSAQFARPLGATMIVYGLLVLTMGLCTFRYFRVQHTLPRGFFPTSLHGVAGSALILGTFMTVLFGILVGAKT
ncbi:hypothetical protein M378DRAFT_81955 [Amanita muscaria Koide BX008]|uniref:DUF202 domain-containing protein n=1 Tax=Amanita muscaria (strain Koide BX008) TaxID=946122 RepID=A0A0C2WJW8_AMAMK|nr:hypothetical protein M378DRAFT_81955 [Amanita muscaria Koide BX008]